MRYLLRCTLVAVLVTLISINSAVACRYLLRRACYDPCLPAGHASVVTTSDCYVSPNCAPCTSPRIQIRSARVYDCACPQIECPEIDLPIQSETLSNEPAELIENPQETPTLALPTDAPAELSSAEMSAVEAPVDAPAEPAPILEIQPATPAEATIEIPADPKILSEPEAPAALPTDAPAETPADTEDDDLFGDGSDLFDLSSILRKPGGIRSDAMRVWTDNTGTFTVTAKLQSFGDGSITLLKENGHVTTLSLRRLSKLDLTFATLQASTLRTIEAAQTASR